MTIKLYLSSSNLNQLQSEDPYGWNGFNNKTAREKGKLYAPSLFMLGHLLDSPPSHPDTIITCMDYMKQNMEDMDMEYVHISCDMQLYIPTVHIRWHNFMKYQNVIPHPGGMHIIMSYVSGIGKLMEGSGLDVYVGAAYGSLTGIFNGKVWVKSLRAFRDVVAGQLKSFLSTREKTYNEIQAYLERARLNETGRHWVDNFIAPTMLVHLFLRAEQEGDFNLRHYALYHMLRVFFVAGHVSYGRYMLQYLEGLKDLPKKAIEDLETGAFVCRHKAGHFNGTSGDQFGEQTAVKEEKSKLKGISLEPEQVAKFVDSLPIIAQVVLSMDEMYGSLLDEEDDGDEKIIKYKEEMPARKHLDKKDHKLVHAEIVKYDHPQEDTRPYLVNPVTGKRASPNVNVQNSKEIGDKMVQDFRESLPDGFHNKKCSKIVTMASKSTPKTATKSTVLPLELMCLNLLTVGKQRNVSLKQMLSHELCAQPPIKHHRQVWTPEEKC